MSNKIPSKQEQLRKTGFLKRYDNQGANSTNSSTSSNSVSTFHSSSSCSTIASYAFVANSSLTTHTNSSTRSKIRNYSIEEKLLNDIGQKLVQISQIPIPRICDDGGNNKSYTYGTYFGLSAKRRIPELIGDFKELKVTIKEMEEFVTELKDVSKFEEFRNALQWHVENPQYYPDIENIIKGREDLSSKFEPHVIELKNFFNHYQTILLSETLSLNLNKPNKEEIKVVSSLFSIASDIAADLLEVKVQEKHKDIIKKINFKIDFL